MRGDRAHAQYHDTPPLHSEGPLPAAQACKGAPWIIRRAPTSNERRRLSEKGMELSARLTSSHKPRLQRRPVVPSQSFDT